LVEALPSGTALFHPPQETALQTAILVFAIGLFAAAAYGDVRARQIPNALPLAIAGLGLLRLVLAGDPAAALWTLAAAGAVFAASFLQWWRGLLGGGDAKLLAAASLLVGSGGLFGFLIMMSLCGAIIALAVLAASRFGGPPGLLLPFPGVVETPARPSVPYGVAIAAAGAIVLFLETFVAK
jgi:prepilin peptidase CpaA